jgi:NAD(P)H-dependent flavin oxidoreductase YrpB (nitropropane dioxygenase family)
VQSVTCSPVGQSVGQMNEVESVRDVIYRLVEEYVDAVDRLNQLS